MKPVKTSAFILLAAATAAVAADATPSAADVHCHFTTPDRILYGSDFPYAPAPVLAAGLAKLRADLAADPDLAPHAEAILGGNAQKLFHAESQSRRDSLAQSPQSPQSGNETSRTSRTSREESNAAIYRIAEIDAALPPDVFRKVQPPK